VKQGEIWWAVVPGTASRRPVLILTRTSALSRLTNVSVGPLTRTIRQLPSEVILSPDDGVPSICAVSLDNIVTVRKAAMEQRIASLSAERMKEVFEAIHFVFNMPH
jgi:mRNA interferase MazF